VGEGRKSGNDQAATDLTTGRRLTVTEAAEVLGISGDAVRSRIKRGTLETVREGGRVWVVLGDTDRPTAQAQPTRAPGEDRLYQEMQERIRYLEEQVEEEREARRRADTLLARLMDRLPELEAPSETLQAPETTAQEPEGAEPRPNAQDAQEHDTGPLREWTSDVEARRRPWWRRMFGG
jgi:excisionase family DNA binding protein